MFNKAQKIRETDADVNRKNTGNITDEIRMHLTNFKKEQERIQSLEQQVINASEIEMKLRRRIRNLERELTVTQARENLLPKSQPNSIDNDPKGYFGILGLHPNAFTGLDESQIRSLLARNLRIYSHQNHPDKGGDAEKMKLLNEAYNFFMGYKNRTEYGKS
jgi:hypothetical protein